MHFKKNIQVTKTPWKTLGTYDMLSHEICSLIFVKHADTHIGGGGGGGGNGPGSTTDWIN